MNKKSTVKVSFIIHGNNFDVNQITNILNINPTDIRIKGLIPEGRTRPSPKTSWYLSTQYEESYDIVEQLNKVIALLQDKKNDLIRIKSFLDVNYIFSVAINIEESKAPAFFLSQKELSFINEIGAELDLDMYIL